MNTMIEKPVEKKNLYFQRSNGEYILLKENCSETQASTEIHSFLDKHNFKSYYTRIWNTENGNRWYDVGSHTEFFIWGFVEINS